MARKYPVRMHIPVTQDTYDLYKGCAEAVGMDMAAWVRQYLEGGEPAMQAMMATVEAAKAGRPSAGMGIFAALMRSAVAQGQLSMEQAQELQEQLRAKEGVASVPPAPEPPVESSTRSPMAKSGKAVVGA